MCAARLGALRRIGIRSIVDSCTAVEPRPQPSVALPLVRAVFRIRSELMIENLALRQQLAVLKARRPRPRLSSLDRAFWITLRRLWPNEPTPLIIVTPETVIRWYRVGFRAYWRWKSRRCGRPATDGEVRKLIGGWLLRMPRGRSPKTCGASEAWLDGIGTHGVALHAKAAGRPGRDRALEDLLAEPSRWQSPGSTSSRCRRHRSVCCTFSFSGDSWFV